MHIPSLQQAFQFAPHFQVAPSQKIARADWLPSAHKYAAIHIEGPFVTIPNAYKTLLEYMRVNGLEHIKKDVIPCFETDGDCMDIYIACK